MEQTSLNEKARQYESANPDASLAEHLGELFDKFVRYQNMKDMQAIVNCLHKDSISRPALEKSFEALFDNYTLAITVLDRAFGGYDGVYAYYRFSQKIEKITGPEFNNMLAENLIVFRQQDGKWKLWNCLPLWMKAI